MRTIWCLLLNISNDIQCCVFKTPLSSELEHRAGSIVTALQARPGSFYKRRGCALIAAFLHNVSLRTAQEGYTTAHATSKAELDLIAGFLLWAYLLMGRLASVAAGSCFQASSATICMKHNAFPTLRDDKSK